MGNDQMIVLQETLRDCGRASELDIASAISALRATIDEMVQAELKRFQSRLRSLTPSQRQAIEVLLREIGIKIMEPVIRSLKQAAEQGNWQEIVRLCVLFGVVPPPFMEARADAASSLAQGHVTERVADLRCSAT